MTTLITFGSVSLALLLFGSIADVPVMFLAVKGILPLSFVLSAGFCADIIPDFFWYWLGGKIGLRRFERLPFFRQDARRLEAVDHALDRFGGRVLFFSKFVYLFGIPAQIVAGAHRFPLRRAFIANALGSAGWLLLLYALAHLVTSTDVAEDYLSDARIAFSAFAAVAILIYIVGGKLYSRVVEKGERP